MTSEQSPTIRDLLRVLQRRGWVLVQCTVIVTAAVVLLGLRTARSHSASAKLFVGAQATVPVPGSGGDSGQGLDAPTAAELIRTPVVADRVRQSRSTRSSAWALINQITTAADPTGNFVTIRASGATDSAAVGLVNAFANAFLAVRADQAKARVLSAISVFERQLAALPKASPQREALLGQITQLRTAAALTAPDAEVVQPGVADPVGKHPLRDGAVGLGLGLLLGLIGAFGLEAFDPRLSYSAKLTRQMGAPQLASVPGAAVRRGGLPLRRRRHLGRALSRHADAFEHLRASLLAFNRARRLKTILVTSASDRAEGASPVAAALATSLARSGLDVCLVDADVRHGSIAEELGVPRAGAGLTEVLSSRASSESVRRRVELMADAGEPSENGRPPGAALTFIAAGSPEAAPGAALAGERMRELLAELERNHDMVIITCAPVLATGDALSLAALACGVALVARVHHTTSTSALRAQELIGQAGGRILGIVAAGVPARDLRKDGYGPWPASLPQPATV